MTITNSIKTISKHHHHQPTKNALKSKSKGNPLTTRHHSARQREKQKARTTASQTQPRKTAKAQPPPYPPLPRGFDPDAELLDPDNEQAARWLCAEAVTRLDGGQFRASLSLANARRYVARFDRWRIKAALSLARRDPATKNIIGRMDYLLRTSVATEAQELQDEMNRLNDLDQAGD